MSKPDPHRRQHHAAHLLTRLLHEHPGLPAIDWTVSQHGLHAHFYLCDVDPSNQREAFAAWRTALNLTHGPGQGLPGVNDLHAYRYINDVLVILTATVQPF